MEQIVDNKAKERGFKQSPYNYRLFIQGFSSNFLALIVYVDDLLIKGHDELQIRETKQFLHQQFMIKDLGYAKYFLGLEIAKSKKEMLLNQRKYILDILQNTRLQNVKPMLYPLPKDFKLDNKSGDILPESKKYRKLRRKLLHLQPIKLYVT